MINRPVNSKYKYFRKKNFIQYLRAKLCSVIKCLRQILITKVFKLIIVINLYYLIFKKNIFF